MKKFTIKELQNMRESEDHVEFKRGDRGNISPQIRNLLGFVGFCL